MDGVRKDISESCTVYFIERFSDELKQTIRNRLVSVCYGAAQAESSLKSYSYQATIVEFLKRYHENENEKDNHKRNLGMIGELLFHILFEDDDGYIPVSAFFNLEERSFKKGFDAGYYSGRELWIAEIKSGEKRSGQKYPYSIGVGLLNSAKNDLKERLNTENNSIWLNAINHAKIAMADSSDEKKVVMELLGIHADDAAAGNYTSKNKNVILAGIVFHPVSEAILTSKITAKHKKISGENIFANVISVVVQQSTLEEVHQFLEGEVERA